MSERIEVPVGGGRLACFRLSHPAAPEAATVLAVHGITSTSRTWRPVARHLGDGIRLVAVDLRGRGESSELPGPFGLDSHVRDLLAVLDFLGLEHAVLTGHSLGAYVVARLARHHPERVQALVLVDGALTLPIPAGYDRQQVLKVSLSAALARLALTFPDREAYRRWWREHPALAGSDVEPADLDAYADHDLAGQPGALRPSVNPAVVGVDGAEVFDPDDASHLAVPAVLLHAPRGLTGQPPPMLPGQGIRRWVAGDPGRRRAVEIPDTNHYTIALGRRGSTAVAGEIRLATGSAAPAAAPPRPTG